MEWALFLPSALYAYNRTNYLYDRKIAQTTDFLDYNFQVGLYGQFRTDIRNFFNNTCIKMETINMLSSVEIGLSLALYTVGRPKAQNDEYVNHFLLVLFTSSVAASASFSFLAVWFSHQCIAAAHADNLHLLLYNTRLPIPTSNIIEDLLAKADLFEEDPVYRDIPFVPNVVVPFLPDDEFETIPPIDKRDSVATNATLIDSVRDLIIDKQTLPSFPMPSDCSHLHHVQAYKTLQPYWVNFEIYARICLSIGTFSFFRTLSYFCLFAITRHEAESSGISCTFLMIVSAILCIYADLVQLDTRSIRTVIMFAISPLLMTFVCFAELQYGEKHSRRTFLNIVAGFALFFEAMWYCWVWGLCAPDAKGLPTHYRAAIMFLDLYGNAGLERWTAFNMLRKRNPVMVTPRRNRPKKEYSCVSDRTQALTTDRSDDSPPSKNYHQHVSPCFSPKSRTSYISPPIRSHAASVGFVGQPIRRMSSEERERSCSQIRRKLHMVVACSKHFPPQYHATASDLRSRGKALCGDFCGEGDDTCWIGVDVDLDGYGSVSRYYVHPKNGLSWDKPEDVVELEVLLSEVESEINMLEQSRVPCTKFEGVHAASEVMSKFEGVHAASEGTGIPTFQKQVLRLRYGKKNDTEHAVRRINGTFLSWKVVRISLATIIGIFLIYALMGFSFFTTSSSDSYINHLNRPKSDKRRLLSSQPLMVLTDSHVSWPFKPRALHCSNGSLWLSNDQLTYHWRNGAVEDSTPKRRKRRRSNEIQPLVNSSIGFAVHQGKAVRYERYEDIWRRVANIPLKEVVVDIAVRDNALYIVLKDSVLSVLNGITSVVHRNAGRPWERACYDGDGDGFFYFLSYGKHNETSGDGWEIRRLDV